MAFPGTKKREVDLTAVWEAKNSFSQLFGKEHLCEASSGRTKFSKRKPSLLQVKPWPPRKLHSSTWLFLQLTPPHQHGSPQQPLFKAALSGLFFFRCVFTSLNVLIYKERSYFLIAGEQRLLGSDSVLRTLSLCRKTKKALVTQDYNWGLWGLKTMHPARKRQIQTCEWMAVYHLKQKIVYMHISGPWQIMG